MQLKTQTEKKESKNILMLESTHFESHFKVGCHHYAENFAKLGHRVFYLSHYISPLHYLSKKKDDVRQRVRQHKAGAIQRADNLFTWVPHTFFPLAGPHTPSMISSLSLRDSLREFAKQLSRCNFANFDLVILSHLQLYNLTRLFYTPDFSYHKLLYRCTDDQSAFPDLPAWIIEVETTVLKEADFTACTSFPLYQRFKKIQPNQPILHLPNGVDFSRFQQTEQKKKNNQVIYVGAIEEWFDVEMIHKAAMDNPQLQFDIIGPVRREINRDILPKNIAFLGARSYPAIPNLLANALLGIIPFKRTDLINSVSPIKLFEYMAAGLPVVSTRWKELEHLQSPALLVETPEQFSLAIKAAIKNQRELQKKGLSFAKNSDWQNRAQQLLEFCQL